MRFCLYILLAIIPFTQLSAQTNKMVRKGNKLYEQKDYKGAASAYQEALKTNPTYTPGLFNLGNSLYQQKQFEASRKAMEAASKTTNDKNAKSTSQYNIGNSYMQEQKWQEAVDAYKNALKNNPQDGEAKYNLSYALQKLKQEQQQNKDKKNDKDKKDDKKDQDKKDENKKDDQNKDKDKKDENKDQDKKDENKEGDKPKPQPSKLSEKQAEQILNALQQEEKKLHDKKEKGQAVPVKLDKDW